MVGNGNGAQVWIVGIDPIGLLSTFALHSTDGFCESFDLFALDTSLCPKSVKPLLESLRPSSHYDITGNINMQER